LSSRCIRRSTSAEPGNPPILSHGASAHREVNPLGNCRLESGDDPCSTQARENKRAPSRCCSRQDGCPLPLISATDHPCSRQGKDGHNNQAISMRTLDAKEKCSASGSVSRSQSQPQSAPQARQRPISIAIVTATPIPMPILSAMIRNVDLLMN